VIVVHGSPLTGDEGVTEATLCSLDATPRQLDTGDMVLWQHWIDPRDQQSRLVVGTPGWPSWKMCVKSLTEDGDIFDIKASMREYPASWKFV